MKQKKKWMIPLCVIGGLLLVCAGLLWYMVSHSLDFSVGRCLVAENGSYMFIDGNSPIVMSNRKDKEGIQYGKVRFGITLPELGELLFDPSFQLV